MKIASEVAYQVDLHPGEVLHWVTDLGWIMGPWEIVGALALGSTVFLFDGAPTHPAPDRLWSLVERHRITTLGVSPTLIRAIIPSGAGHVQRHDVSSLRILASTGEPWNPDAYLWLHREVGASALPIINLSGGTEVGACFLSPLPICELKPCTLRGPALGMDLDIVDATGAPVGAGEVGELVCRQPWPAMTRGIWGDPERYLDTYWRRFPGIWVHGDWATRDEDGFWFLHGRSDDTLSVAGKRLGPAEVESALASHPAVAESAAIGVPHALKGETIWCFVVVTPGAEADAALGTGAPERGGRPPRTLVPAVEGRLRARAPEDAQRQDRPARDPGGGARGGSRRSVQHRGSRVPRRDPGGAGALSDQGEARNDTRNLPSASSKLSTSPSTSNEAADSSAPKTAVSCDITSGSHTILVLATGSNPIDAPSTA